MRYVNPETNQDHRNTRPEAQWHLKNDGGQLWILGIKTEGPGTNITTCNGGRTELLGGLVYSSGGAPARGLGKGTLALARHTRQHAPGPALRHLPASQVSGNTIPTR